MKKRILGALSLIGLMSLSVSCDNDFSVSDDWSDVTVVYSLLDPAADTNWVRIERGYLGDAAASQSYGIPDSLYYDSLVVILNEYNEGNELQRTITLERDNTSRDRQPGVFTTNDYRLYRTTEPIDDEFIYEIVVQQTNAKFTDVRARTEIVGGQDPNSFDAFGFITPRDRPGIAREYLGSIKIVPSERAVIYQVYFTLRYKEYDIVTKEETFKSVYFQYATLQGEAINRAELTFSTTENNFAALVAKDIPVNENKIRFVEGMKIDVYAGGEDLLKYMILNAPTTGVGQTKPEFPQIEEGTGLFSSRTVLSLDDVDFRRTNLGAGIYTNDFDDFYLAPALCDRNFVRVIGGDSLVCTQQPNGQLLGQPYR